MVAASHCYTSGEGDGGTIQSRGTMYSHFFWVHELEMHTMHDCSVHFINCPQST